MNAPVFIPRFAREVDREVDDFFDAFFPRTEAQWTPVTDIEEGDDHFLLTVDMPGIPKDQIQIELNERRLTVSGERRRETKSERGAFSERKYGKFGRSFTLPAGIDAQKIEADYRDGVLKIYVPKAEAAKPKQIKIGTGGSGFLGKLLNKDPTSDQAA